jgi:hypothetical protein
VVVLGWSAGELRRRFWSPAPEELTLEAHEFGRRHRLLGAVGFRPAEAAILAKDLQGLVRRRELLPMVTMPIVLGVIGFLGVTGPSGGRFVTTTIWVSFIAGFFALLLGTVSIGQERRAVQNLYALPVDPTEVFRAKAGLVWIVGWTFAVGWGVLTSVWYHFGVVDTVAILGTAGVTVLEGTFIGLYFASRYPDFQERPRPQFLRPAASLAAFACGLPAMLLTAAPVGIALGSGLLPVDEGLGFAFGAAAVIVGVAYILARASTVRLLRQFPF